MGSNEGFIHSSLQISDILEGRNTHKLSFTKIVKDFEERLKIFKALTKKDRSNCFTFLRTSQRGRTKGEQTFFAEIESSLKQLSENLGMPISLNQSNSNERVIAPKGETRTVNNIRYDKLDNVCESHIYTAAHN